MACAVVVIPEPDSPTKASISHTGIIRELENTGISQEFIRLEEGISRINVKLRSIDGTEINGRGPEIKKERLKELTDRLYRLQRGDVLFLSGSIPVSVPENIYSTIMQQLKDKDDIAKVLTALYDWQVDELMAFIDGLVDINSLL